MEITKIGVVIVSLVVIVGLGMYIFDGYTGAFSHNTEMSSSSVNTETSYSSVQCDNTDSLDDTQDGLIFDTIYKKGKVKVRNIASSIWAVAREDICVSNVLHEGYCTNFGDESTIVTCEKGCNGGKCNLASCVDSDNGMKYDVASSTSGIMIDDADFLGAPPKTQNAKTYTDSCSGVTLNEYYCSQGFVKKYVYECQNGCNNGKCNAVAASSAPATKYCEEDKPDNSIFVKAGVRTKVGSGFWSSYTYDYCSGNTLVEYYCNYYKNMEAKQVICSYGCSNGKCNYPPCTDPDSPGSGTNTKSTTTGLRTVDSFGIPPNSQIKSYTDECTGSFSDGYQTKLNEYSCSSYDGTVQVVVHPCTFVTGTPGGDSCDPYEDCTPNTGTPGGSSVNQKHVCQNGACTIISS